LTDAEKLEAIREIYDPKGIGHALAKCSDHARYNLEGALHDMVRTGKADAVCGSTLKRVIGQLAKIEEVLEL
jgi:hypothetical protein